MSTRFDKVVILTTGGTIEKVYDELDGNLENRSPMVHQKILTRLRLPHSKIKFFSVLNKDSQDMNDEDRNLILASIKHQLSNNTPIIVIHGTDTMAKTAEFCKIALGEISVPIIFTGAMRPLGFENTDAFQNVTESLMASKVLSPGVYIVFHGEVFDVPNVEKDKLNGTFKNK
ncbi:MAG: asparaginase [Bdellovibrionales bacterium]|nr:asparaginase [Bdellovibrionales bacterium]